MTDLRERLNRAVEQSLESGFRGWMHKWVGPAGIADDAPPPPSKLDTSPEEVINAILSEIEAAGYAVVPREPTEEMISAAAETKGMKDVDRACIFAAIHAQGLRPDEPVPLKQAWQAMIEASEDK